MRQFLLSLFLCTHVIGWGQINSYHSVVAKGSNNASLVVDDVTGLKDWDKVMVIQMKGGVTMDTDDNSQYGTVSNYSNAGMYEVATICRIDQSTKTLHFVNELRPYDFGEGKGPKATEMGRIQVVKIAVYESYTVTGTLEPPAWDSATGKGGVLAMIVEEDLILNGNISADGKGFKGGKYVDSNDGCSISGHTAFVYNPTNNPQSGAYKGESIFRILVSQGGGKGANANGGGGGNNHNNGGGGGANLTSGGNGGGNNSVPDGWFGCINADPGIGGKGITVASKDRIFMGGGGGAGQINDALMAAVGGGAGGGIIFIQANKLTSLTHSITANGIKGGDQQGDGAAGGGAGGTIIMNVANYGDAVNIQANGGNGGTVNNENIPGNCYGEGGGGGGGVIYFKGLKPGQGIVSVAEGKKGALDMTTGCRSTMIIGSNGSPGKVIEGYSQEVTGAISGNCPDASSLPVKLIYFKATHKGPYAAVEWKVENPEDGLEYILQRRDGNNSWRSVQAIPAEDRTTLYQKGDGPLATGIYLYRLKIVEKDRSVAYSPVQQVTIKAEDINRLLIHPNPATSEITIVTPVQGEEWLNIYDMKSRLVYRKRVAPSNSVIKQDISFLSEGVYMIQVGKLTARFVVFK